jgi:hypothetical protein
LWESVDVLHRVWSATAKGGCRDRDDFVHTLCAVFPSIQKRRHPATGEVVLTGVSLTTESLKLLAP